MAKRTKKLTSIQIVNNFFREINEDFDLNEGFSNEFFATVGRNMANRLADQLERDGWCVVDSAILTDSQRKYVWGKKGFHDIEIEGTPYYDHLAKIVVKNG